MKFLQVGKNESLVFMVDLSLGVIWNYLLATKRRLLRQTAAPKANDELEHLVVVGAILWTTLAF